jgi:hypothetical protein
MAKDGRLSILTYSIDLAYNQVHFCDFVEIIEAHNRLRHSMPANSKEAEDMTINISPFSITEAKWCVCFTFS